MEDGKIRIGLYKKKNGYGLGKPVEIFGQTVWVNLYKNDKTKDTQPDLNLVIQIADPIPSTSGKVPSSAKDDDIPF